MKWTVVFAPSAAAIVRKLPPDLKRSIQFAIEAIAIDPYIGKPLVRDLLGLYSYPMRRYRIVYALDHAQRRVLVIAVGHRAKIYEEVSGK